MNSLPHRRAESQSSPGRVQVPQLALQQSSPTLHVLGPQATLLGTTGMPHTSCEHFSPGGTQVPQLALQQTRPAAHTPLPHCSPVCATATGAVPASATAAADDAAEPVAIAAADGASPSGRRHRRHEERRRPSGPSRHGVRRSGGWGDSAPTVGRWAVTMLRPR